MKYSRRKTFATRFITIYNLDEKTKTNKSKWQHRKKGQHTRLEMWGKWKWKSRCRWSLFACLTFLMFVFSLFLLLYPVYVAYDEHVYWLRGISWFPNVVRVVYLSAKWQGLWRWVVDVRLIGSWYVNRTHAYAHSHCDTLRAPRPAELVIFASTHKAIDSAYNEVVVVTSWLWFDITDSWQFVYSTKAQSLWIGIKHTTYYDSFWIQQNQTEFVYRFQRRLTCGSCDLKQQPKHVQNIPTCLVR